MGTHVRMDFISVMVSVRWRLELVQRSAMDPVQSQGCLVGTCAFRLSGVLTCMTNTNGLIAMDSVREETNHAMEHVQMARQHVETGVFRMLM